MSKIRKTIRTPSCWNSIGVWSRAEKRCEKLAEYVHCRNCPVFSDMGRSVFEKSAPSGYLAQWRKAIADKSSGDSVKKISTLVFRVGEEWFAFSANSLSEVSTARKIHRIPQNMNPFIAGVVNINGEINVCYSLQELLGISPSGKSTVDNSQKLMRLIVVTLGNENYVFLVDEVLGLYGYSEDELLPLASTISEENSLLLQGTIKQSDHQVAIFNESMFQKKLEGAVV